MDEAKKDPAIIQFTEGFYNRPWIDNSLHPLREVFIHYHQLTQWADVPSRPDRRSIATRIIAWSFLNLPYWGHVFLNKMMNLLSHVDFIRRMGHYRIQH